VGALRDILKKTISFPELQKDLVRIACFLKPTDRCQPFFSVSEDENLQLIYNFQKTELKFILRFFYLIFSRFCMNLTPVERRERIPVNVNLKGLLSGKKNGSS